MTKQEFQAMVSERILILDGATGSNLLKRGMPYGVCTELWVTEHPDVMRGLQEEYIAMGSDIVYAPTFSGNRVKLLEYGLLDRMEELNKRLVEISREAAGEKALVAGDITMTGAQLAPMGEMSFDTLREVYEEQVGLIAKAGADLLVIETMMSLQETRAAVLAAKKVCDLPILATLSFKENGKTLYGVSAAAAAVVLWGLGVDAVGLNCSAGPDQMLSVVKEMKAVTNLPIIAKPNAGLPKLLEDGTTGYDMDAKTFAGHMEKLLLAGADIIGGCCGSTPEFIGEIARMAAGHPKGKITAGAGKCLDIAGTGDSRNESEALDGKGEKQVSAKDGQIYLASEREVYTFAPGQKLVIGEDIDYSRQEELVEEYRDEVFDTAVDLAFDMEEEADILRICGAAEGFPEEEVALAAAEEIARSTHMPLMLATERAETIAYVLEHFSGIIAIQWNHNLEEWETQIKSMAKSYHAPIVTIDNEIIYC